jgi:hypothetical protein
MYLVPEGKISERNSGSSAGSAKLTPKNLRNLGFNFPVISRRS